METEIKYNRDLAIVQANELVRSRQDDLSVLEAKIIKLAIAQVLKNDTDLRTYTCNVADLARFLNISNEYIYMDIQNISKSLIKKSIFIRDTDSKKKNYKIFNWVDYIEYKDGVITIRLSEKLKPYLLGLNELFTKYEYDIILRLPNNKSMRLYELLTSYRYMTYTVVSEDNISNIHLEKNEYYFTIDYLKEYFNLNDKYSNTADFIKRVIKPSVEAIEKHTLMRLEYRTITKGRKIEAIVFKIKSIADNPDDLARVLKEIEEEKQIGV